MQKMLAFFGFMLALMSIRTSTFAGVDQIDFDRDVRPILTTKCIDCHSGDKPSGKLDMLTREALLKGSKTGAVIEPGDAVASPLLDVLKTRAMPPKKSPQLTDREIQIIEAWIEAGASWKSGPLVPGSLTTDTRAGFDWWSLKPVQRPRLDDTKPAIDQLIELSLKSHNLIPNQQTDRRTLIRRITFDLHGLPPTPEEIETYISDKSVEATERLIDRLLASPRFGERWARHWLDVVRFAESHGYEHDSPRPNAWPYRDYVIKSINDDKPYDQFVIEQIAGDVISPQNSEAIAATGYLVAGPFDEVGSKVTSALMRANVRHDELEDLIGVTGQTFLGLTLHCARCHNHKFDPITQEDYYRVQALFAGVKHDGPAGDKLPAYVPKKELASETRLLHRGDVQSPGRSVAPGFLCAIGPLAVTPEISEKTPEAQRRKLLAAWLVDPANPLTARVIVNRIWQHHFGQGIVATPSDFGFNGARPTHPELLDWLASEFVAGGWKMKRIHRMILLSDSYQRSGDSNSDNVKKDADNRWLWRYTPRRLESEELRDSVLALSGRINLQTFGKGFDLFDSKTNAGTLYRIVERDGPAFERRSIYRTVVRGLEAPLLASLDCPDASTTTPSRSVTTTPLQSLSLWNDRFILRHAAMMAERLERESAELPKQISRAYQLVYGRSPSIKEQQQGSNFIKVDGLASFCRVLINSNEFLFVE
jgi:hypothetical protein